jgi:hypothetical protein
MAKPAASRLGDVLLPLAQIIARVAPDRSPGFLALARHLEAQRRDDRALSWEAAIVTALSELADEVSHGLLLIGPLAERVNEGRPEQERLSNRRISDVVRLLGLVVRKAHGNKAAVVWDDAKIATLAGHYATTEEMGREEEPPAPPAGGGGCGC